MIIRYPFRHRLAVPVIRAYNHYLSGTFWHRGIATKKMTLLETLKLAWFANYGPVALPLLSTQEATKNKNDRYDVYHSFISTPVTEDTAINVSMAADTYYLQLFNPFNLVLFLIDACKFTIQLPLQNWCVDLTRHPEFPSPIKSFTLGLINTLFLIDVPIRALKVAFLYFTELPPIKLLCRGAWELSKISYTGVNQYIIEPGKTLTQSLWQYSKIALGHCANAVKAPFKLLWEGFRSTNEDTTSSYHKVMTQTGNGQSPSLSTVRKTTKDITQMFSTNRDVQRQTITTELEEVRASFNQDNEATNTQDAGPKIGRHRAL